jgi:hypothetical protein
MRTVPLVQLREEMLAAGDVLATSLTLAATLPIPSVTIPLDDDDLDDSMDGGHSPDHVAAPIVVSDAAGEIVEEVPADPGPDEGRRPQRRRGRRGGRRNRPGGASGPRAPEDGGVPS